MSNTSSTDCVSLAVIPTPETIVKPPDYEWATWQILGLVIPMSLLVLEIVLGNLLVIVAVLTQRNLRTPSNMIILSLAIADLAVGIFILPFNMADMFVGWRFGKPLCRIWLTSDVTLCSTSILHISAIAVDRFRSINEGVQYAQSRSIRASLIVCGALWLIALWIASSPVLGWNDWKNDDTSGPTMDCHLTRELGYIIHSASGAFFIPAAIMVGLYFRIFLLIRNKLRERAQISCVAKSKSHPDVEADGGVMVDREEHSSGDIVEDASTDGTKESILVTKPKKSVDLSVSSISIAKDSGPTRKKHSEQIETILRNKLRFSLTKEKKAAKTLGIIIGCFIICWTPFTMVYLMSGIFGPEAIPYVLFQSVTWLGYVNSGLNPIIYTIYNPDFRRAFNIVLAPFTSCCT